MILAGDIGGTKTLLGLFEPGRRTPVLERRYASASFDGLEPMLERFLGEARGRSGDAPEIDAACFGVAGPVLEARVRATNLPWELDAGRIGSRFGIERVRLLNDFAAAACGIDALGVGACATLQAGEPLEDAPRVLIGAGTGLGIAYLLPGAQGGAPLAGEGGHGGFAPANALQLGLWRYLAERYGRVTLEHVVSGSGLLRIYDYLLQQGTHAESAFLRAELAGDDAPQRGGPAAITRHALERGDPLALAALDLFIACYGAAAGDHALNVMARGGVYVAGGIAPKILPRIAAGGFVAAFTDKGAFAGHARRMPLHVVTEERLGLLGASLAAATGDAAAPGTGASAQASLYH